MWKFPKLPSECITSPPDIARLNKKDEAFEWLEKALNNGAAFGSNISADEDFENIKGDEAV